MLDYTKAAIKQTIDDFKKIDYWRNIITQVLYLAYLVYAIIFSAMAGTRLLWVNAALFVLSSTYFAFFLYVTTLTPAQKLHPTVKRTFKYCKRFLKLYTLGIMLYGLCLTTTHITPLSVILTAFMIVGWVLEILFDVVLQFFINRAHFILEGMEADYENITKPVRSVGNFFKKMAGREVEEEKPKSKNRIILDQKVADAKQERADKKREEKFLKKEKKILEKMRKLDEKKRRHQEKNGASENEPLFDEEVSASEDKK